MTEVGSTAIDRTDWTTTGELGWIATKLSSTYGGEGWSPNPRGQYTDADGTKVRKRDATHITMRFFAHPWQREHIDEAMRCCADIPGFVRAEVTRDSPGGWPAFRALFTRGEG